ncbi:hypothetical protein QUF70_17905, partial [Desulfobacterales bacterium HSG17]|nr:hypothetical protein [Desulfobacterales bacterium HSG17]
VTYEKKRETFSVHQLTICMDEMPFGWFLELEGMPDTIAIWEKKIDLSPIHRSKRNYLSIFESIVHSMGITDIKPIFNDFHDIIVPPELIINAL